MSRRGASPLVVLLVLGLLLVWMDRREQPPARDPEPPGSEAASASGPSEGATGEPPVLVGTVLRVHDGDTVTLGGSFAPGGSVKVRLAQIDAPELAQPWGDRAQAALRTLARGRVARLEVRDVDGYERRVGDLFVDDVFVNEALVRDGHAWVSRRWVRDPSLLRTEEDARDAGRGLWSLPPEEREPPWRWRRGRSAHPRR